MIRETLFKNYTFIRDMYINYVRFFLIDLGKLSENCGSADLKIRASIYLGELAENSKEVNRCVKLRECVISIRQSKKLDFSNTMQFIYFAYPFDKHEEDSFTKLYLKNSVKENRLINNLFVLNEGEFTNEIVYRFFENTDIFFRHCTFWVTSDSKFRNVINNYYKNGFTEAFNFIKEEITTKPHFIFVKFPPMNLIKSKREVAEFVFTKLTSGYNEEPCKELKDHNNTGTCILEQENSENENIYSITLQIQNSVNQSELAESNGDLDSIPPLVDSQT